MDNIGFMEVVQSNKDRPDGRSKEVFWQGIALETMHKIADIGASRWVKETWMHSMWASNNKRVSNKPDVLLTNVVIREAFQVLRDLNLRYLSSSSNMDFQD